MLNLNIPKIRMKTHVKIHKNVLFYNRPSPVFYSMKCKKVFIIDFFFKTLSIMHLIMTFVWQHKVLYLWKAILKLIHQFLGHMRLKFRLQDNFSMDSRIFWTYHFTNIKISQILIFHIFWLDNFDHNRIYVYCIYPESFSVMSIIL